MHCCANFRQIGQMVMDKSQFFDFQDQGRPPFWIFETSNFNIDWDERANMHQCTKFHQNASPYQISSKLVKRFSRYCI